MPKAKAASLYGVHPGVAMAQKWVSELKKWLKTAYDLAV